MGAVGGLRFRSDSYVPAGEGAFGSDIEAKLEIVTDVVGVGFAAVNFTAEYQIRLGDGGLGGFWFVVILERGRA